MAPTQMLRPLACVVAAALAVASCANDKEPAQKLLGDIEGSVNAATADAAKYVPDQLQEVQGKLGELKASFDKQDYKDVLAKAPPVLGTAQGLEGAAVAKRDLIAQGLNTEWATYATSLPGNATAIEGRIDFLSKPANKKLASGVDLDAARAGLNDAIASWTKAQSLFTAGNLQDAVATAKSVKTALDALAASMKLDLKQPAAVKDTAPV